MLKRISTFIVIIFTMFTLSGILKCEIPDIYRELYTISGNCNGNGFASAQAWSTIETNDQGVRIITSYVECLGEGGSKCPEPDCVADPNGDPNIDQGFLDNSFNMMRNYLQLQLLLGNLTGYQSFDTYYKNIPVYRSISWNYFGILNGSYSTTISVGGIIY